MSGRLPSLETLLWVVASLAAIGAFLILAPLFINPPAPSTAAVILPTRTPPPTLTPYPTNTRLPLPPAPEMHTPNPLPAPGAGEQSFTFTADPTLSGYIVAGEPNLHWGDRNLHAGSFKGKVYQSVLFFDLSSLPAGTKISHAEVDLTGLSRDNLGARGSWKLELAKPEPAGAWVAQTVTDIVAASFDGAIGSTLGPANLALGQVNQFVFTADQRSRLEASINATGTAAFRLEGSPDAGDSLFTWEGGGLDLKSGTHPVLKIVAQPAQFVVITNTPTPENVLTAAAYVQTESAFAAKYGTPTPFPRNFATATPIIYVTEQPTPSNMETRVAVAQYATAVAMTTGTYTPTPANWIMVTPVPPTWTPWPTSTPRPTATGYAMPLGSLTPIATPTSIASAATLIQTPVPDLVPGTKIPFKGNIIFFSDRYGGQSPLLIKPDGSLLTLLTGTSLYYLAAARDQYSPDHLKKLDYREDDNGIQQVIVVDVKGGWFNQITRASRIAYDAAFSPDGHSIAYVSTDTGGDELYVYDLGTGTTRQLTFSDVALPWNKHPSWSPDGSQLVFWSSRSGIPQIWMINRDGSNLRNLSNSTYSDTYPVWVKP